MRGTFRSLAFATAGVIALATAGAASAATNLVQDPDFSNNNAGASYGGQINYNPGSATYAVVDWTVGGSASSNSYDFVFNPAPGTTSLTSADNNGALGADQSPSTKPLTLWGPGTSSNNGLTEAPTDGGVFSGAFVAVDPAFQNSNNEIYQTVSGLTMGQTYSLTFEYAAAEQTIGSGASAAGATSAGWTVCFGGTGQSCSGGVEDSTGLLSNPAKGFTGWDLSPTYTFTANSTSEVLGFIADGGSNTAGVAGSALPPFALLADVSLTANGVPEPATWAMMLLGIGGLGGALRMRRKQLFAAA